LKETESSNSNVGGNAKGFSTMRQVNPSGAGGITQEKDWMNFSASPIDRPTTAASANSNQKVKDLQEELKIEKKEKKHLIDEIENLKREVQKSNFSAFT